MEPQVVVGAAIVRAGRVLAARRTAPAASAGRWEFPGGKVEQGESEAAALVREVDEELGVQVRIESWLPGEHPLVGSVSGYRLKVALVRLVDGEPTPVEHDQVRWLAAGELDDVDWLDGDRRFLSELSVLLPRLDP